jgi:hypothetical protein
LVSLHYRTRGVVHKPRLDSAPGIDEARTIGGHQRPDVETFDSCRALFELGFSLPLVTAFLQGTGIFSVTELAAQLFGPALSEKEEHRDAGNHDHDHSDDCS